MTYTYDYPRPCLTVDCVVFGFDTNANDLRILLIQRRVPPYKNDWALPGGFVEIDEDLETAAKRELSEETGLSNIFLEQLYTFGAPQRDPRDRVVSVAYYALVNINRHAQPKAADDAENVAWFSLHQKPKLAFDHEQILQTAIARLRGKLRYQPIGFELLPEKFPLSMLQRMYEIILEEKLEKRNFRKKILSMDILNELNEYQQGVAHRAARLYSFDEAKYEKNVREGFSFEINGCVQRPPQK